jgi:hypothetical protein
MPPLDPQQAAHVAAAVGVALAELPPLVAQCRGHVYDASWMTGFSQEERDFVVRVRRGACCVAADGAGSAACAAPAEHTSSRRSRPPRANAPAAQANRAGLLLTLLGGALGPAARGAASKGDRSQPCVALMRERDTWLLDAGEDTQRAVLWLDHLKPSKVRRWRAMAGGRQEGTHRPRQLCHGAHALGACALAVSAPRHATPRRATPHLAHRCTAL